jgi:hypothetical protein
MSLFFCPYLDAQVELTEEREKHIAEQHPDLLPQHRQSIAATWSEPGQVRQSRRLTNGRLFTPWFESVRGGKYVLWSRSVKQCPVSVIGSSLLTSLGDWLERSDGKETNIQV